MVAVVFQATMSREQARRLARLMRETQAERPEHVLTAFLLYEGDTARIVAIWKDRDALDRYLAQAPVPRGTELMRAAGAEPGVRTIEVLEYQ